MDILSLFIRSDERKAAEALASAYINKSGIGCDAIEDNSDGGDWLGMGDKIMVAEITEFKKDSGEFNFNFINDGVNGEIIKNKTKMRVINSDFGFTFFAGDESVTVKHKEKLQDFYPVIDMAKRNIS